MIKKESRNSKRLKRHSKIRQNITGTSLVPRLNVFRSNNAIYAQIIDDEKGTTLLSSSSLGLKEKKNNIETAIKVGKDIAEKAKAAKIKTVVFDRGGYAYHGKVKALADEARKNGLKF